MLLCKKPPGILRAHSTARVCSQSILDDFKIINVKGRERGYKLKRKTEVRRQTRSSALGIESSESGRVPWESVVRCTVQTVRFSSEKFIDDEGTLPLGFELVLLLLREA